MYQVTRYTGILFIKSGNIDVHSRGLFQTRKDLYMLPVFLKSALGTFSFLVPLDMNKDVI